MQECKAPGYLGFNPNPFKALFLAGSIENGKAEPWQEKVVQSLANTQLDIYNPRRDDWDSSWIQDISNKEFKKQVEWEQYYINYSNYVVFYFDPSTLSPISLLEFGQVYSNYTDYEKVFVCCPPKFWKRGNIQVMCYRYNIPIYNSLDELIVQLQTYFGEKK